MTSLNQKHQQWKDCINEATIAKCLSLSIELSSKDPECSRVAYKDNSQIEKRRQEERAEQEAFELEVEQFEKDRYGILSDGNKAALIFWIIVLVITSFFFWQMMYRNGCLCYKDYMRAWKYLMQDYDASDRSRVTKEDISSHAGAAIQEIAANI